MKAFIIYVNGHEQSEAYANDVVASIEQYSSWEPILFEGITPETLHIWERRFPLSMKEKSRAACFLEGNEKRYNAKKSCSLNHYRLHRTCAELNETIAVIEHDSYCLRDWSDVVFDDVLVLNAQSAIKQPVLRPVHRKNKRPVKEGVHDIKFNGLTYRHDPEINGAYIMPGTAAYAITPRGAKKMIDVYEKIGWEQSDFIINTAYVRIQTIIPEFFTFKHPNLKMSHGE